MHQNRILLADGLKVGSCFYIQPLVISSHINLVHDNLNDGKREENRLNKDKITIVKNKNNPEHTV
ncbi:hypothetical protein D3C81_2263790 [compost metagenome]